MNKISVVIPVKNEMKLKFHRKIIKSFIGRDNFDLIWVLGKNNDGTFEDLQKLGQKVVTTVKNSRAARLNIGIREAKNDVVLLNHPRSFLTAEALDQVSHYDFSSQQIWGGFTHKFYNNNSPLLKFTSFYSNHVRLRLANVIYLDHCIFFSKSMLSQGEDLVKEVDIFEDTYLSYKLRSIARPIRLKGHSITSPVRFESNGFFKQAFLNQKMKLQFHLGTSKIKMNKEYEKNLNLNSTYT